MFAGPEFRLQQFDRAANHAALQLYDASIEGNSTVHGGEETKRTFAAYVCGFYGRAIFQNGQQREDGALRKICVLKKAAGLANDGAELEVYLFKVGRDLLAARNFQCTEQLIALHHM